MQQPGKIKALGGCLEADLTSTNCCDAIFTKKNKLKNRIIQIIWLTVPKGFMQAGAQ